MPNLAPGITDVVRGTQGLPPLDRPLPANLPGLEQIVAQTVGAPVGLTEMEAVGSYQKGRDRLKPLLDQLRPELAEQIMQQYDLAVAMSPDQSPEALAAIPGTLQGAILGAYQQSGQLDQIDRDEQQGIADLMAAWQASTQAIDQRAGERQAAIMAAQQMVGPLMERYTADMGANAGMVADQMRQYQQYLPAEAAGLVGALAAQQQGQAGRMAAAYQASGQAIPAINSLAAAREYQQQLQEQQAAMMAQIAELQRAARDRRTETLAAVTAPVSGEFAAQLAAITGEG